MAYEIENIPIPDSRNTKALGKSKYPFAAMKAGESFYAPTSSNTLSKNFYNWFKVNFPGVDHRRRCSVGREGEGSRFYLLADHPAKKPELVKSA